MISSPVLLSAVLGQPSTSIQDAIQAGSTKDAETRAAIAKALFDAGAKFERLNIVGQSLLLSTPIELGNLALVELLIDHGASVTATFFDTNLTPTELAEKYGHEDVYKLLVSRGGTPVDKKSGAQFALVRAAENNDLEGMQQAITNGAQVNNLIDGETALSAALGRRIYLEEQANAIRWLLDHGADPT